MPRPNDTEADTDYQDQKAAEARRLDAEYNTVVGMCNKLLRAQIECGKTCAFCPGKCEALQEWLDFERKV